MTATMTCPQRDHMRRSPEVPWDISATPDNAVALLQGLAVPTRANRPRMTIMRELTHQEVEQVQGSGLANLGAGLGGATIAMGSYSIYGGIEGELDFGGFAGAGTAGFIAGAGFGHPTAVTVGAAAGGAIDSLIDS